MGAAHGHIGILFILLHLEQLVADPTARSRIIDTLDFILDLETPNGNWPAVVWEEEDHLLHFCHGAPGAAFLFAKSYSVFGDERYRRAALRAGETIWKFGLLRKGPGLCHGIAGNGYALLALFKMSGEALWLDRAIHFGLQIGDEEINRQSRVPDHPSSLFEGYAGALLFLADLLVEPRKASFPLFEFEGDEPVARTSFAL